VSAIVLEDDNIRTMETAIAQGRTVYANIRKSIHFLLATNLSEILLMLAGTAAGFGQLMTPMQLLWINLVTDVAPALALALEPPEPNVLDQPPRNPQEEILSPASFGQLGMEASAIATGALAAGAWGRLRYGPGPQSGTLATGSLLTAQLLHAATCRSDRYGLFRPGSLSPNRALTWTLAGSFAVQLMAAAVPPLRRLLGI